MLSTNDLRRELSQLSRLADKLAADLGDGLDVEGLALAAGLVELDRLQTKLTRLADRLSGSDGRAKGKKREK